MTALGLLSLLLRYPDDDLLAARADIVETVTSLDDDVTRDALRRFLSWFAAEDGATVQAAYVDTFDFGRTTSLHLTYPTHGDRRERGMALLEVKARYAVAGMVLDERELPDHLAVMLEFADTAPGGRSLLTDHRPAIEALRVALHDADSPYAHLLDALGTHLGPPTDEQRRDAERIRAGGPPTEAVGLEPFAPPDHVTGAGMRR